MIGQEIQQMLRALWSAIPYADMLYEHSTLTDSSHDDINCNVNVFDDTPIDYTELA